MILFLIGIVILFTILNFTYYEYRVQKETKDMEVFETWVNLKLKKRYKC